MPSVVQPQFRPTARDLLAPTAARLPRPVRWALGVVVAALVVLVLLWRFLPQEDGHPVVVRAPVAFNLRYSGSLDRVAPQGDEMLRLEGRRGGTFVQSLTVRPLTLPAYRGDVGGILPIVASGVTGELERRFDDFELVAEGKGRVNEVAGYTVSFRARLGRRRLFGREVLLPQAGSGGGVRLLLLSTPAGEAFSAADVGSVGALKRPYRSFRFGTEAP